jgi:hypothetical protein
VLAAAPNKLNGTVPADSLEPTIAAPDAMLLLVKPLTSDSNTATVNVEAIFHPIAIG